MHIVPEEFNQLCRVDLFNVVTSHEIRTIVKEHTEKNTRDTILAYTRQFFDK